MVLYPFRRLYHTGTPPLERGEAGWEARCHTPPPLEPAHTISGSSRPFISATPLGVTSAVRVARRRRTDMVMQASMWVLGVAAVERQLCRSEPTVVRPVRHFLWPTAIRPGHHAFLRGGRPIPPLPASTRRAAGSAHTLPLFLGYRTIPYRAKIRNPARLQPGGNNKPELAPP